MRSVAPARRAHGKGVRLGNSSNLDVASSIASLLGVDMKHVSGHAIREIVDASGAKRNGRL
jgi:hypothetical protein